MKSIIVSVDVGSDFIKAVATEIYNGELFVLGSTFQKTQGFERNKIINTNKFVGSVNNVLAELENLLGIKIDSVVLSLSIDSPKISIVTERTPLTENDGIVAGDDVKRVISRFKANIKEGRSIINVVPMEICIDNQKVSYPVGKKGNELSIKAMVIDCANSLLYPILVAFEKTEYDILDVCLQEVADSFEVLAKVKKTNKCLINVGYQYSRVTLYKDNSIKVSNSLNFGFRSLYNVVMKKYLVDKDVAYKIIETIGSLSNNSTFVQEFIVVENINGNKIKITHSEVNYILKDVASELFIKMFTDFQNAFGDDFEVAFTGGLVEVTDFELLIKEIFGKHAFVYSPKYMGARNSVYSVCIGLSKYMYYMQKITDSVRTSVALEEQKILASSKKNWKNLDDNSVAGKIFGLFFE